MSADRPPASEPYPGDPAGHFPPLDGLRGLALLMILFHHNCNIRSTFSAPASWIAGPREACWSGVNLFFVLSGFLIGGILLDSRGQRGYFRNFYARRSLRIFPLYYAFLIGFFYVLTPLAGWLGVPLTHVSDTRPYFLYYINWAGGVERPRALDPLWSLSVEEQIYLVWPAVIALTPPRFLIRLMAALVPAALAWRVAGLAMHKSIMWAYTLTPACLDAFAVGTIVAALVRSDIPRATLRRWALLALSGSGLFLAGMAYSLGTLLFWNAPKPILTLGLTALAIAFASAILYLVTSPVTDEPNRLLSAAWLRSVGRYSYAMYLVHTTVAGALRAATGSRLEGYTNWRSIPAQGAFFLASLAITYGVAVVSWHVLEAPFLRLKRYFPTRGRGVPGVEARDAAAEGPTPAVAAEPGVVAGPA